MILLVDNYDSFVFNLARYFQRLGQATRVVRNNAIGPSSARAMRPSAIVLSPGPCRPREAGCSLELVRTLHDQVPILGICLGHQAIAEALGGQVVRASEPVHGRSSLVYHDGRGLFDGIPNPFHAARYHSLVVAEESLPGELEVMARTADGVVMAIAHRVHPVVGLQFHPESILTQHGYQLLQAFLRFAGIEAMEPLPSWSSELWTASTRQSPLSNNPVTF